ncbi:unnamed protein product [Durusdinium trenchii]|uniref:Uncharacterized protein n=2 Tax=Durusdinium trenchii TaxID=1381693 RepID=A0ABP0QJQ5_9DINO
MHHHRCQHTLSIVSEEDRFASAVEHANRCDGRQGLYHFPDEHGMARTIFPTRRGLLTWQVPFQVFRCFDCCLHREAACTVCTPLYKTIRSNLSASFLGRLSRLSLSLFIHPVDGLAQNA